MGSKNLEAGMYIDKVSAEHILINRPVYIFGVCVESGEAAEALSDSIQIIAFVDNYKHGANNYYQGKRIISVEHFLTERKDASIIIATNRFAYDIVKQLTGYGLVKGKDIYVWDNECIYHSDVRIKKIESRFSAAWTHHVNIDVDNIVLIPFDNFHVPAIIKYAYCANYMARKYCARIYGYSWLNFERHNASEVVKGVYQSFGMIDVVDSNLDNSLQKEVQYIFGKLWAKLHTWEDWNEITIYGIHFGTTILRDFFRRNVPPFELQCELMKEFLLKSIRTIVFWYDYFIKHNVKAVIMNDGTNWDGYIRDIAVTMNIPAYAINVSPARLTLDFAELSVYQHYDKMWDQLSKEEQAYGIKWSKKRIQERISGNNQDVALVDKKNFAFSTKWRKERILHDNDKLKLLICPHSFEEDSYWYGEHIFDNNYFSWLCHLGELSEKYSDYEWYLKPHPTSSQRDNIIIDSIVRRYPRIIKLPNGISPIQLRDEGIEYALTVCGTIGHEYPAIGIQVINAGLNPHSKFDFCWNPKTKEEYDELIQKLKERPKKGNINQLYAFYAMRYLYYDWNYVSDRIHFFDNPLLDLTRKGLRAKGYSTGPWIYEEYLKEFSIEKFEETKKKMGELFRILDQKKPGIFYKRQIHKEQKTDGE